MQAMDCNLEKECNALGGLFQSVINEMKGSYPAWEDVGQKAVKLSVQLRSTIIALNQFLDALQKISDYATNTKGATRDIGTALTRICMRHRSMENRLKTVSSALIDCLVLPLQEHADDWQKRTNNLDKDHAREYKKTKTEIRKRSTDTIRLQKKVKKGENRMQPMLESAVQEMNDRYSNLLDNERRMCRAALTEQRSQFCYFVSWFKPILDLELGLLEEASHLREVTDLLCKHATEPNALPPASEAVICDAKGLEHTWTQQFVSPPSSPSSLGSRKSSFCSLSSSESNNQPLHYAQRSAANQNSHYRAPQQIFRGANQQAATTNGRFTASHDSGIANSQDVIYAPASQHSNGSLEHELKRQPMVTTPGGMSQQSTPSPSPSAVTWPEHSAGASPVRLDPAIPGLNLSARQSPRHYSQSNGSPNATPRPHTISAAEGGQRQRQRPPLGAAVFIPPQSPLNRPATLGIQRTTAAVYKENNGKPPLPGKRQSSATPSLTPTPTMCGPRMSVPIIPDFNAIQPDQFVPQAIYASVDMTERQRRHHRSGSSDAAATGSRRPRPLSFVGDNEDMQRLLQAAGMAMGGGQSSFLRDRSSFCSDRGNISNSGSSATMSGRDEDEDTLIEEALGQIDRLTIDLDSYCHTPPTPAYCTLPRQRSADGGIVRWRPGLPFGRSFDAAAESRPVTSTFCSPYGRGVPSAASSMSSVASTGERRSSKAPPPPPLRRNSTITAATPTAPSVELLRSSRCTTPVEDGYSPGTMYSRRPPDAGVNDHNYQLLHQTNASHLQPTRHIPHYQTPYVQQSSSVVRGSSEPPSDQFSVTHETLLLQIRNGVHLRRAAFSNDRSLPHV